MRCNASSSSSWLCGRYAPVEMKSPELKPRPRPFFFSFFTSKPVISCCTKGPTPTDSSSSSLSTRSYSRRWYNPLRRSQLDEDPDIARHWIDAADQPLASQGLSVKNSLGGTLISFVSKKWISILIYQTFWQKLDMLDHTRDAPEVLSMVVLCFGKLISFDCYKEKALNSRVLDYVIMLLNSLFLRQMCKAASKRSLIIGNIHVLYNPSRGDVKLGQIRFLLSRAQKLSEKWGNAPIVLAGDFNSTPQSAIYRFLSSSELNVMLYDRRELSGQRSCHPTQVLGLRQGFTSPLILIDGLLKTSWTDEEVKVATGNSCSNVVEHPLKLNSSYAIVTGSSGTRGPNGEPLATSYHSKFLGTVDYLWYSECLVPTKVLDTTSIDVLQRTGGLPYKNVGSDHLALVSEFAFTTATNVNNNATVS
ncbi:hypothetical protein FNV43_RR20640 [Rhamnella rubrinervis]|uniref:Endonuclease/exonuclease/phosphatase domain-containing protein n=1 Tax=Rhamnella rubrinervis TaxID=2594499 RepID=A0A8K0E1J1_9ROSA|nr:hypothetical protein FNV43_RR20640 [Rhamnella rubrinervis]